MSTTEMRQQLISTGLKVITHAEEEHERENFNDTISDKCRQSSCDEHDRGPLATSNSTKINRPEKYVSKLEKEEASQESRSKVAMNLKNMIEGKSTTPSHTNSEQLR